MKFAPNALRALMIVLSCLVLMFIISWKLSLYCIIGAILVRIIKSCIENRNEIREQNLNLDILEMNGFINTGIDENVNFQKHFEYLNQKRDSLKKKRVCSAITNGLTNLFLYCFSFLFRLSTVYYCWYLYSNSFDTDISVDNLGNLASFDWIFAFYLYVFLL